MGVIAYLAIDLGGHCHGIRRTLRCEWAQFGDSWGHGCLACLFASIARIGLRLKAYRL